MLFDKMEQAEEVIGEAMKCVDLTGANNKIVSLMNELAELYDLENSVIDKERSLRTKRLDSGNQFNLRAYSMLMSDIGTKVKNEDVPPKNVVFEMKKDLKEASKKIDLVWQQYVSNAVKELYSSLEVTRNISCEKQKIDYILREINELKGSTFEREKSFQKIDGLVSQGSQVVEGLGLTKEVESFLRKTMTGQATIADLSDEILGWIKKNQFEQVIKIGFL